MATLKETMLNGFKVFWQRKIKPEFTSRDNKLFFTMQPYLASASQKEGSEIDLFCSVSSLNNTTWNVNTVQYQWQYLNAGSTKWVNSSSDGCTTPHFKFEARTSITGRRYRCRVTYNGVQYFSYEVLLNVVPVTQ